MTKIKELVEMVRKTEPDAVDAQPKTYSNPKWDQYRSQQERLLTNKQKLFYHFSDTNEVKSLSDAFNNIHTAFDQFHGSEDHKVHNNRMANVAGFLADVAASGIEYGRAITLKKLPPEELERVNKIGKDKAVKLAMHAFAHALLPRVIGIDPGGTHHLHMDSDSAPRMRNHEFISHTLSKGLLPPDILTIKEDKVLGSEIIGDAYSFLKAKHAEVKQHFRNVSDRAYEVGQARGGLKYDHEKAHWVHKAIDLAAIALPKSWGGDVAMDYVKSMPLQNVEPWKKSDYKPTLGGPEHAAQPTFLNPTAHHRYTSQYEHPRDIAADQYRQAVAANDQEAIYSAHKAYVDAPLVSRRQKASIPAAPPTPKNEPETRTRSLGTFSIQPAGEQPLHPDLLPSIKTSGRTDVVNRKAPKAFPDNTPINLPDNVHDDAYDWMSRDEHDLKTFAQTVASREPKQLTYQPADVVNRTVGGASYHTDPTLVHTAPERVEHPDMEIIPPKHSTADLDKLNPNLEYPSDLSGLSNQERANLKKSSVQYTLKDRIQGAVKQHVDVAKQRLAGWDQDVPTQSGTAMNVPDFKHAGYVPPKTEPDPLPPAPLSFRKVKGAVGAVQPGMFDKTEKMRSTWDVHSFLKGAATFSTSGNKTPEETQAMLDILAPTEDARKNAAAKTNFPTPTKHIAGIWKKVHSVIQANPELHNDPRAHAALHYARASHDYFDDRGVGEDERYEKSHIATMYKDMGHILAPSDGAVHPELAHLGHEMHAIADEYDTSDTDLFPQVRKLGRDIKAGAIRTGRRAMRSQGMADLRPYLDAITSHPLAQKAGAVAKDVYQQWKHFTEEEMQVYCDLLSEGYTPDEFEQFFGKVKTDVLGAEGWQQQQQDIKDKEAYPAFSNFRHIVYHMPREHGGIGIEPHPLMDNPNLPDIDSLKSHPLYGTDTVSKLLGDLYPTKLGRVGGHKRIEHPVVEASKAVRVTLSNHLNALEEHTNKLRAAQENPKDYFNDLGGIKQEKVTLSQVMDLAHAIHDHLATDPHDRTKVHNIMLQAHIDHFLRANSVQSVVAKSSLSLAKKAAEVAGPVISKAAQSAVSGVVDLAHDAVLGPVSTLIGKRPNERSFRPRSTIGKVATRVAIAAGEAPGAALDFLSGPDALAGPGAKETLAKAKIVRANQHRDKLAYAGLMMDPVDKSIDSSTRKRAAKLATAAAIEAVKQKKRARG